MRSLHIIPTLLFTTPLISARLSPFSSGDLTQSSLQRRQSTNTTWPYQTFHSEPNFHPPVLEINGNKPCVSDALFFAQICATCIQEAATIFTPTGELIWQSNPNTTYPATNFQPQWLNGKQVLVYNMAVGAPIDESGAMTYTTVSIYDDTYTLIHNISVVDPEFVYHPGSANISLIDSHESYISPSNTLIVPGYNITPWDLSPMGGEKEGFLLDGVVYEVSIPEGEVLWKWKASEHIGIEDSFVGFDAVYGYGNDSSSAWDYIHINSAQAWGDDGIVISARNTYDVFFVNKTTGDIEWRIRGHGEGGDLAVDSDVRFSWQHDARLYDHDGELLLSVFDNRNTLPPPWVPTEGHIFALDLEAKTAKVKTTYVDHSTTIASQFGGSMQVDFENEYVVLAHGSQPVLAEYNLNGTLSTTWRFGPAKADFGIPPISNYRGYRSAWKGYPVTKPAVKACKTASGTDVYVSWNGATEVESWKVFAGQDEVSMLESISAPRTGFETKICLGEVVPWVKVQAVGNVHDERFTAQSSEAVAVLEQC